MWFCPKCGEQHEDQFKVCWKCAGEEVAREPTAIAVQPLPTTERKLRPLSSILARAGSGFLLGMILGSAASHRVMPAFLQSGQEYDWLTGALVLGAGTGAVVGLLVGLYFWVAFPYEPIVDSHPNPQRPA